MIKTAARRYFGEEVRVWLFGSRVDDTKRGGGIDLYVEANLSEPSQAVRAEIEFLADVKTQIGDQKIDVLVDYPGRHHRPEILEIARETGVIL